jgi:hypothetical protein
VGDDGPVRGALVRALRVVFYDGQRNTAMAAAASTDDRGEYRLFGLAPGAYLVDAVRPQRARIEGNEYVVPLIASNANGNRREMRVPLAQALIEGTVDPAAYESGARVPNLYPGTMDEESAIPIDLAPGTTVPGVDIVITPVPAVTVTGRLIPAGSGVVAAPVGIGVRRLGSSSADSRGSAPAIPVRQEANGAFVLQSVPSGRYELTARTGGNSNMQFFGRTVVEVGDRDVADVQIVMTPGLRVSGHLVVDGVRGRGGDTPLMVQLVARQNGQSARLVPDDGSFVFENVAPQDYWLRIQSAGRTISPLSIRFGSDTSNDGTVTVTPDRQADALVIAVTLRTGDVDVAVVDRNQRPVSGVTVALVPDPARRRYSGLYRTASSGADGRVRFTAIEPGRYTLVSADVAPDDWQNPDVLQRFERTGIAVQVEPAGRQSVSLVAP